MTLKNKQNALRYANRAILWLNNKSYGVGDGSLPSNRESWQVAT